jgi:hypothetical protein
VGQIIPIIPATQEAIGRRITWSKASPGQKYEVLPKKKIKLGAWLKW